MSTTRPDVLVNPVFGRADREVGCGEPEAVEAEVVAFFDQFRDLLLRYVLSLGLPVHDGEEIIQETFLALFRHLHLGKSQANLRGWLFRVAHNLALRRRHANRRYRQPSASDELAVHNQTDRSPDPEQQLMVHQRQKQLQKVFRAMPEQDQWCLQLRAEGLRYREIAEVLGIALGSVSISLARSLARLARADEV